MLEKRLRVLLTGATGGIGQELARDLVAQGYDVFTLGYTKKPQCGHAAQLDLCDATATRSVLAPLHGHIDTVVHYAHDQNYGQGNYKADTIQHKNPTMIRNLCGVFGDSARYILASSVTVFGANQPSGPPLTATTVPTPTDAYGLAKQEMENTLLNDPALAGRSLVQRLPRVVAPTCNNIVNRWVRTAQVGQPITVDCAIDGQSLTSSFSSVANICRTVSQALQNQQSGIQTIQESAFSLETLAQFIAASASVPVLRNTTAAPHAVWNIMQDNADSTQLDASVFLERYVRPLLKGL